MSKADLSSNLQHKNAEATAWNKWRNQPAWTVPLIDTPLLYVMLIMLFNDMLRVGWQT